MCEWGKLGGLRDYSARSSRLVPFGLKYVDFRGASTFNEKAFLRERAWMVLIGASTRPKKIVSGARFMGEKREGSR